MLHAISMLIQAMRTRDGAYGVVAAALILILIVVIVHGHA